jgi:HSP20 family protein
MSRKLGPMMEVARIQSEINRLFDNLLDLGSDEKPGGSWIPNADILETRENLILRVELPGVAPETLAVSVHGDNIIVRGAKATPERNPATEIHTEERVFGPFRRVIRLEVPVNTRQAEAALINGLLRISFPKVPNRRGEEVPIEVQLQ